MLHVSAARFAYRGKPPLFTDLEFSIARGEVLCVLGPNGVGKSTLLRCIAGLTPLSSGSVEFDIGTSAGGTKQASRSIGFVPQSDQPVFAFDVRAVVEMGRAPHLSWTALPGAADAVIVDRALARLGITRLADRLYPELSGGERQLVMIARALAQQPALLILDEPTSHLDFANQASVLDLIRGLADDGLAIVMTTHDPGHAFLIADQVLVLSRDRGARVGAVKEVLTEVLLAEIYGRPIRIVETDGRVLCFAESRRR